MNNNYKVLEVSHLSESVFRLRTERPNSVIRAGQCFSVGLMNSGINREYSMYSGANDPFVEFLIKAVDGGRVSQGLQKLTVGEFVEINGPYGDFCLQPTNHDSSDYLFIGTGTGIAPFRSFIRTYPHLNYTVLHGIRSANEQFDADEYKPGSYIPCISQPYNSVESKRVTDFLVANQISVNTKIYLCGNRNMIVDAFEILREKNVPGDNLFTEVFF
ncbi:oxidoreductase [Polynucleobacter wuianus]|uniref:FAD-binding oxidoreductase n=1 Tax=Polynucleobacter wuianus TaxID=1743168 RepID=UPI001C0E27BA|nr:FAD-binding oxidoreductase [Polynucleobacter wuianus]MBU3610983.1 oxidoreductase [Polynucleobacter wuianus]